MRLPCTMAIAVAAMQMQGISVITQPVAADQAKVKNQSQEGPSVPRSAGARLWTLVGLDFGAAPADLAGCDPLRRVPLRRHGCRTLTCTMPAVRRSKGESFCLGFDPTWEEETVATVQTPKTSNGGASFITMPFSRSSRQAPRNEPPPPPPACPRARDG